MEQGPGASGEEGEEGEILADALAQSMAQATRLLKAAAAAADRRLSVEELLVAALELRVSNRLKEAVPAEPQQAVTDAPMEAGTEAVTDKSVGTRADASAEAETDARRDNRPPDEGEEALALYAEADEALAGRSSSWHTLGKREAVVCCPGCNRAYRGAGLHYDAETHEALPSSRAFRGFGTNRYHW